MRRIMLLTLALALPTVALATSFTAQTGPLDFSASSSTPNLFANGISPTNPWVLNLVGLAPNGDTIKVTFTHLFPGCFSPGTCLFAGTVTAAGPSVPGIFTDAITGTMTRGSNSGPLRVLESLTATLATNPGVGPGSDLTIFDVTMCANTNNVCAGIPPRLFPPEGGAILDVDGPSTPVPEPGTLGLLELGLLGNVVIGLVGMARRKLKLGT